MITDMCLDQDYQLLPYANGDATLIDGNACFLQTLKLEAAACEGDLWYDPDWGWSLLDFKDALQDDLVALEISQRVRQKLSAHEEIAVDSIQITMHWETDSISISTAFRLLTDNQIRSLKINIGSTEIEVIDIA